MNEIGDAASIILAADEKTVIIPATDAQQ